VGSGTYPVAPPLREVAGTLTDGEIFYHVKNGIRNTAMPAWPLPDAELWQLVAAVRALPEVAPLAGKPTGPVPGAHYVGSASCKACHEATYARWSKSLMANVVRDPREHPDAIIPDLAHADPMVKFTADDVALVYGSKWKQRYFKKVGDDYFPYPAQWDVTHKAWKPYFVAAGTDWWSGRYPPDNFARPTGPLCDGCHSVNYDVKTKAVTEWNVGCEKCHGPGSEHLAKPTASNILNPARMDAVQASDTCIQCHSQGRPRTNPIEGRLFDWPVGFEQGRNLVDFWELEGHTLGEKTFTHFPDGTGHKNRMQGNDFVQSLMYARGVTCFSCHDAHGSEHESSLKLAASELCLSCHGVGSQNGPHVAKLEDHTHHAAGSTGSACIACHMPKIEQTIGDVNVRSHPFHFVAPGDTDRMKIPNACNLCHADKSTEWATTALKSWSGSSPWRMER
jgi:predicted CXXCH cytochrome family protein